MADYSIGLPDGNDKIGQAPSTEALVDNPTDAGVSFSLAPEQTEGGTTPIRTIPLLVRTVP